MKTFVNYLIEANLGICFFLGIYWLFLKRETDFRFNRAFLLVVILLSVVVPLFHFSATVFPSAETLMMYWLPQTAVDGAALSTNKIDLPAAAGLLYCTGAVIFLIVFLLRLYRIGIRIYRAPKIEEGSIRVIETGDEFEVFSFFKYVFVGNALSLSASERRQIIAHELVHVKQLHSVDMLLTNIVGVLCWFNPLITTYRKQFVLLHEFEADARSVDNRDVDDYCSLLAKATLQSSGFILANYFTNSLTLKRIQMMKTLKRKIQSRKVLMVAAAALAFCYFVAGNDPLMAQTATEPQADAKDNKVYEQVDELPTLGNQNTELFAFITKNLKYPQGAKEKHLEGKVFVQFVVEKDGTVTDVKVVKGIGHGCDDETVRVIKMLPKWSPGKLKGNAVRTAFTLPVAFRL